MPKSSIPTTSADVNAERLLALQNLFPEAFSEGKVDFEKLRAALGDLADERPEKYTFTWAGKRDAIRTLQMPTRATLIPVRDESVNFDDTQNLYIEGDNLEVLKLLAKSYARRVKMIYIDPPYNTGNDFVYPDDFSDPLGRYLQLTGQQDAEGNLQTSNPETSGRYHSAWLSMMYPRLFLARQLLSEDGVILVSIDDTEINNLRLLMVEIFGEENFISQISVVSNPRGRQSERFVATVHEYLLVYAKNINDCLISGAELSVSQIKEYKYSDSSNRPYRLLGLRQRGVASRRQDRPDMYFPIYINPKDGTISLESSPSYIETYPKKSDGSDGRWMWGRSKVLKDKARLIGKVVSGRNEWDVFVIDYLHGEGGIERTTKSRTVWTEKEINYQAAKSELRALFGEPPFEYPKPVSLLKRIIKLASGSQDTVLDFFSGSATMAQAVLEINREDGGNRRFILVQLPEPTDNPQYPTIAEIGKERIRRVIQRMKDERAGQFSIDAPEDLGFRVYKLAPSNFKPWVGVTNAEREAYHQQMEMFQDAIEHNATEDGIVAELIIKHSMSLASDIEKTGQVYKVTDGESGLAFTVSFAKKINPEDILALGLGKNDLFICRDSALDDTAAANLALNLRLETI